MHLCRFEDRSVADLEPLALTRPVFDLLCGLSSLADKQAGHFQASARTAVVRPHLAETIRRTRRASPSTTSPTSVRDL